MKNIKWHIKQFVHHVKNLIYWFPVIWNDYDWDYIFMLKIMRHKLNNMQNFFNSKDTHVLDAEDYAKEISEIMVRLDRIIGATHLETELETFYVKYPDFDFAKSLENSFVECEDHPGMLEYKSDMTEDQEELFMACSKKSNEKEQEDYEYVFNTLRDRIQHYWD
jgi:hypothetical protein